MNKNVKEELSLQAIDYTDMTIYFGNICDKCIHVKQDGAKRFARNVRKYIE